MKNDSKPEVKNEIVVYQPNETVRLEVELHDESIWLTQQKIADLFGVQKAAISKHLKNIFATGELRELESDEFADATRHEFFQVPAVRGLLFLV